MKSKQIMLGLAVLVMAGMQQANAVEYPSLYWSTGCDVSCSGHQLFHDKAYNSHTMTEQLKAQHGLNSGHTYANYGWASMMQSVLNRSISN